MEFWTDSQSIAADTAQHGGEGRTLGPIASSWFNLWEGVKIMTPHNRILSVADQREPWPEPVPLHPPGPAAAHPRGGHPVNAANTPRFHSPHRRKPYKSHLMLCGVAIGGAGQASPPPGRLKLNCAPAGGKPPRCGLCFLPNLASANPPRFTLSLRPYKWQSDERESLRFALASDAENRRGPQARLTACVQSWQRPSPTRHAN